MNNPEQQKALETYFELMSMNGGMRIFQIAHQVGLFQALAAGPLDAAEAAKTCGLHERPTRLLLDGLCGLDTVRKVGTRYALAPVMQFLSGHYQDLSSSYWDYLPGYLKTGAPTAA